MSLLCVNHEKLFRPQLELRKLSYSPNKRFYLKIFITDLTGCQVISRISLDYNLFISEFYITLFERLDTSRQEPTPENRLSLKEKTLLVNETHYIGLEVVNMNTSSLISRTET